MGGCIRPPCQNLAHPLYIAHPKVFNLHVLPPLDNFLHEGLTYYWRRLYCTMVLHSASVGLK